MKAEQTKLQIVDAAIEAFWAASYHATNMNDLSRAAGVNKATVYQHFPSKEAIAVAAVARAADRTVDYVFEGAFEETDDPIERLRGIYSRIHASHRALFEADDLARGCPFVNIGVELATASDSVRGAVCEAFERFAVYYGRIVEDLKTSGRLAFDGDVDQIVEDLQDNMNATLVGSKLKRDPDTILHGGDRAVRYLTG